MNKVFVALGGNLGNPLHTFHTVLKIFAAAPHLSSLKVSRIYRTAPVSSIPQPYYLNAVCSFDTSLHAEELFDWLRHIEIQLGKVPKAKDAPRSIDLDLLFFNTETYTLPHLTIPHPAWKERLFVLQPLADLTDVILLAEGPIFLADLLDQCKNRCDVIAIATELKV